MSQPSYPAELYAMVHTGNPGDIDFYRRQCRGAHAVLELGCGSGRVLSALARDPGNATQTLVGLDIDPELLQIARDRQASSQSQEETTIQWVEGDMLELNLEKLFDRIIIPFGGIYCLPDRSKLQDFFAEVAKHLEPGGMLIMDSYAADGFHKDSSPEDMPDHWLERVGTFEREGEHYEVLERSSWERDEQYIRSTYIHVKVGEEEAVEGILDQHYLLSSQIREALSSEGFCNIEVHGDFDGAPYTDESELMVFRAQKAETSP